METRYVNATWTLDMDTRKIHKPASPLPGDIEGGRDPDDRQCQHYYSIEG